MNNANRTSFITFLTLFIGMVVLAFWMAKPFLLAVLMGGILSLICRPLYLRIRGSKKNSGKASVAVTLLLLISVIGPCVFFAYLSFKEASQMIQFLSDHDQLSIQSIAEQISQWPIVQKFTDDPASTQKQIESALTSAGKTGSAFLLSIPADFVGILLQLILTALSCYFLLVDGPRFFKWVSEKIPLDSTIKGKLKNAFKETSVSVIWATLAASAAQSTIILFSFFVLEVPAAFLAAAMTFILAWIPMVGSSPVWITGTLYLFIKGYSVKPFLMIGLGLTTGIVDNIVRPMVLKGRGKMHPLVSLVSIFGGIHFFGFLGVFLGPIIAALLIALTEIWSDVCTRYGLITEAEKK